MRRAIALSLLWISFFTVVGCENDVTVDNTGDNTPTEVISILIGGQCRTSGARIECEDDSRSAPSDQLTAVSWELRSSTTGISIDRRQSEPEGEVSFSGLDTDTYDVEQAVEASDGSIVQQVHGDLIIQ